MLRVAAQLFVMEKGSSRDDWREKTGTQKTCGSSFMKRFRVFGVAPSSVALGLKWKVKGFSKLRADLIQHPKLVWQRIWPTLGKKMPMLTAT